MKQLKIFVAFVFGFAIAGCASVDIPSRNLSVADASQSFLTRNTAAHAHPGVSLVALKIVDVNVSVPKSLVVSEENRFYPPGDIVWRGEPIGDRHTQVHDIFEEAFQRGTSGLGGTVPAVLDVTVVRFHSVTEKTRYSVGGIHSIRFVMTLRDHNTGALLAAPKNVKADLKAFGGQRAIDADRTGQTQRVRIVSHLSRVIMAELGGAQQPKAPERTESLTGQLSF